MCIFLDIPRAKRRGEREKKDVEEIISHSSRMREEEKKLRPKIPFFRPINQNLENPLQQQKC